MGGWNFLCTLLDNVQSISTVIGKIWIRVLFIFRILILATAAEVIWVDKKSSLVCNIQQPGCENICYDWKFPISQIRFWVLQVIFVSMPMLLYLCYVIHVIHQEKNLRIKQHDKKTKKAAKYTNEQRHMKIKGKLLGSYITQLFFRIVFELVFIVGQYYLYGFIMSRGFSCGATPCPLSVDCYMSRPTEKNIFNILMMVVACVSVLLNVMEVFCLLCRERKNKRSMRNTASDEDLSLSSYCQPKLETEDHLKQNKMI
ncbi:connexin 32.3 [Silurus asotus]|uniref:Gap junction protein n=1 Tax=Silurus asotus TaxID=30991 RepID=A0AAD5AEP5_SILAS|nr:connexin 32.3 [Silurus asotus]